MSLEEILSDVAAGKLSVAEAAARLRAKGTAELEFARVDLDRQRRRGIPEAIYCPGKQPEQVLAIMAVMEEHGQTVLATRAGRDLFERVRERFPRAQYHEAARAITLTPAEAPEGRGRVVVVSAGTADVPVAEEACLAAELAGARVERLYDVGVAGLHRLVPHLELLRSANVLVIVAGMEGALPSVVGGLVDRPIVAVPTSVGYSTQLGGLTALLAMLNSCVPGITVVNVDNGYGAGVAAAMINRAAVEGGSRN